jgi:hypothetical protein
VKINNIIIVKINKCYAQITILFSRVALVGLYSKVVNRHIKNKAIKSWR